MSVPKLCWCCFTRWKAIVHMPCKKEVDCSHSYLFLELISCASIWSVATGEKLLKEKGNKTSLLNNSAGSLHFSTTSRLGFLCLPSTPCFGLPHPSYLAKLLLSVLCCWGQTKLITHFFQSYLYPFFHEALHAWRAPLEWDCKALFYLINIWRGQGELWCLSSTQNQPPLYSRALLWASSPN